MSDVYVMAVISLTKEVIPLSRIESINADCRAITAQNATIAALKDDYYIRITTTSGQKHICSMKDIISLLHEDSRKRILGLSPMEFYITEFYPNWLNEIR